MSPALDGRRIAVDARPLCYPGTGIYRYTFELLRRLCRMGGSWFFYAHQHYERAAFELANVKHRQLGLPPVLRAGQVAQFMFPLWARRDGAQLFWGPRHQLPPGLPAGMRQVVTVHDLVWKAHGDTMRFPGRQVESFFTPRALARADVITVVSEFTAAQLRLYFAEHAHKVVLVPNASALAIDAVGQPGAGLDGAGYFLFVGTLEPRKNLPRLLRAYQRYVLDNPPGRPLKIAGGTGWGGEDVPALVRELGLQERVELLGRVGDDRLGGLYRGARALLMPSLYEGFGLPVIEALSLGVPVIVSRDSAMSEVAGSAGLCVDPLSEADMAGALARLDRDQALHDELAARALSRAARYSWDDSAARMAEVLLR